MVDTALLNTRLQDTTTQRGPQDPPATPPQVAQAVESGQYANEQQATNFIFAENFDTFDNASGGDRDGAVSQGDIEAVANSEPGSYPPEVVEFAKYLLTERNAGLLDRLDKGAGKGGDDNVVSWLDVASVLKLEQAPPQATSLQQAAFVDVQIDAIVRAEARGDLDVVEFNEAMAQVLDHLPMTDPAFASALVQGMEPEALARVLDLARYAGITELEGEVAGQLQRLMAGAMGTPEGAASLDALVQYVMGAEAGYDTIYGQLNLILGSSQYGPVPARILETIADADADPSGLSLIDLSGMAGTDALTTTYFEALASNPQAALAILQEHPQLLIQSQMEHNEGFVAAMDTLLANLSSYVSGSGDFANAATLAGILDTLGQQGAAPNREALADSIEALLPQLAQGIASDAVPADDASGVAPVAGNLIAHYLAIRAGDDPQRCVEVMTELLEGMTQGAEFTPEAYGTIMGLMTAGMLKHFGRIAMSAENRQAFWNTLGDVLEVGSAATGFWTSPWGAALGVGLQGVASLINTTQPENYDEFARVFSGTQQLPLLKDEIAFPGYAGDDPAGVAIDWMRAMINVNGYAS